MAVAVEVVMLLLIMGLMELMVLVAVAEEKWLAVLAL
jgi:hypothetical protein